MRNVVVLWVLVALLSLVGSGAIVSLVWQLTTAQAETARWRELAEQRAAQGSGSTALTVLPPRRGGSSYITAICRRGDVAVTLPPGSTAGMIRTCLETEGEHELRIRGGVKSNAR